MGSLIPLNSKKENSLSPPINCQASCSHQALHHYYRYYVGLHKPHPCLLHECKYKFYFKDASWPVFLLTVYVVGGMIGHTYHVLVHDFTHYSGHQNVLVNKAFAIFCNLAVGIPSAISFGRYHSDHHNFFSEYGKDYDLPTMAEVRSFKSTIGKFFFFFFLTPIYALRPFLFMHKKMTLDEIINFAVILCSDVLIYKFWGSGSLAYIILTAFFSIGGHPAAIHTIAEHAEFVTGMESYDYFGIWNFFNLNLGHHIEHHDFPTCPWYNLPAIRAAAPEWYEYLPHHTSYLKVLWKFVTDENFSLFNRTLRLPEKKAE